MSHYFSRKREKIVILDQFSVYLFSDLENKMRLFLGDFQTLCFSDRWLRDE